MSYNVRKFAVFVSIIVIFYVVCCPAADQTVLVVAQDGARLFYHRNGTPTDMEEVPKGTELTIERTDGERCFVTHKGNPAYIRREFLLTKQEFLEAQQKAPKSVLTYNEAESPVDIGTSKQSQAAADGATATPIGYAWPKNDLLIPDQKPTHFKPLAVNDSHPLLRKTDSGYIILCDAIDGSKRMGFLPNRDRIGNPTIQATEDSAENEITVGSGMAELEAGSFPLVTSQKYPVLSRDNQNLDVLFSFHDFTQTISVNRADMRFMTLTECSKAKEAVIADLQSKAERAIEASTNTPTVYQLYEIVSGIFTRYQGDFADDTADVRNRLASGYAGRIKAYQEQFDAEQTAKGLIKYDGRWMTTNEVDQARQQKAEEYARQDAEQTAAILDQQNAEQNRQATAALVEKIRAKLYEEVKTGDLDQYSLCSVLRDDLRYERILNLLGRPDAAGGRYYVWYDKATHLVTKKKVSVGITFGDIKWQGRDEIGAVWLTVGDEDPMLLVNPSTMAP